MVNVSHNRNHRRTRQQIIRFVFGSQSLFDIALGNALELVPEILNNQLGRIGVNRLINRCHNPETHQFFNNVGTLFCHTVSQFLNRNNLGNDHFADDFFLRLLNLNRFGLFFLITPAAAETVIVIVVIGADIVNVQLAAAALRFKTALGYFLALLFKNVFAGRHFFRLLVSEIFIIVFVVKILALFVFNFAERFDFRLFFDCGHGFLGLFRLLGTALFFKLALTAFSFFLFFHFLTLQSAFFLFLTAFVLILFRFGD